MSYSMCSTVGANTGGIKCDVERGRILGIVLGSAVFAASDYATSATFEAAFKNKIKQAAGSVDKLFPFPEVQGNSEKTDAAKEGSLGYGLKKILVEGKPGYEMDVVVGTSLEKKLRKFNNKTVPVFVFDDASNIWGVTDTAGKFYGADCLISVIGKPFEDGQNFKTAKITISFVSASDFYDNAAFASTSFNVSDLKGLVDVQITKTALASNVVTVKGTIPTTQLGGDMSLYDYYPDALAVASLWKASSAGVDIPITSVAKNAAVKGWDVTLDTTAFAALASGASVSLNLADPATLAAADVVETEGIAAIFTK